MVNISITRRKTEEELHYTPVERQGYNWQRVVAWTILIAGSICGWYVVIMAVIQRLGWFYGG